MNKALSQGYFKRNVVSVARELIGCNLVQKDGQKIERYKITETEAYDGPHDLASHASKGRTRRTEIMFGEAGHMYIYLVYGIHWMLNIVTGEKDYPAAVLIRGLDGVSGPGRVTKKLKIAGILNGKRLGKEAGIWIERGEKKIPRNLIEKTARIGVDYAGPIWAKKEYRFVFKH